jgi:alkylation response protein AidB-like acyl-CoA dehydrogenase
MTAPVEHATTPAEFTERTRAAFAPFVEQAQEWERSGHLSRELFEALGAAGIFRDRWTAGTGAGLPLARAMAAELAPENGGVALAVSIHSEVFVHALHRFGGARHAAVLDEALAGRVVGCAAFTEPTGGSDLFSLRTHGTRVDGGWRLAGTKRYTTNLGTATHVLILAHTDGPGFVPSPAPGGTGEERARRAHTLFLVPLDRPGVRVTRFFSTLGMRSADTGELVLDVELTDDDVVGRPGAGLLYALTILDYERVAAATAVVAGARAALGLATEHLRRREQFGRRLFDHQALAHRLADRWTDLQAAAALTDAACAAARGDQLPHHLVAAAKLFSGRSAQAAVDDAIQFLGGRGYLEDFPLERILRDSRLVRIGGGTDEMLRGIVALYLDVPDARAGEQLDRLTAHHEEIPADAQH